MKIKNWFYEESLIFRTIACLLLSTQGMIFSMHFDKNHNQLNKMLEGLAEEEADNLRQSLNQSKISYYYSRYPLHATIMRRSLEDIIALIDVMDIDEKDDEGKTPLYIAAFYRQKNVIQLLIQKGAQPDLVLAHRSSQFLEKKTHQEIKKLLMGEKLSAASSPFSNNDLSNGSNAKKKIRLKVKINRQVIQRIRQKIVDEGHDGVYYFTGLIKKLIINNDVAGLRDLFKFGIKNIIFGVAINDSLLPELELSLRNEEILFHAIKCAQEGDYRIIKLLLKKQDLTERDLMIGFLAAKQKNDDELVEMITAYIANKFPESTIFDRCYAYKCCPKTNLIEYSQVRQKAHKKKKLISLAKICTLGVVTLGFIAYQWLKIDHIYVPKK